MWLKQYWGDQKVSYEAVATVASDNPTGSPPSGMALQSFYVLRQEARIWSLISTSHWMPAVLGEGVDLGSDCSFWLRLISGGRWSDSCRPTTFPAMEEMSVSVLRRISEQHNTVSAITMPKFWYNMWMMIYLRVVHIRAWKPFK